MGPTILIADDERVVRTLLAELLAGDARAILTADSVTSALAVTKEVEVDVALIERGLPEPTGLALAEDLKARDAMTEIIIMSVRPTIDGVIEAVAAGASDFVPKPFDDIEQLASRVRQAAERALLRRERRRLHQALRDSEERYRKLFQASPDAVIVFEDSGRIREVNRAAVDLYGRRERDLVGQSIDLLRPAHPTKSSLDDSCPSVRGLVQRCDVGHQGEPIEVEVRSGVFRHGGKAIAVEVIRDIRDRLQAERERAALEEQLQHAQKMEALGTLAGGVAHDFNNLLTVISNYGTFVQEGLEELSPQDERNRVVDDTEQILRAADSAASLTSQLLAFSRREVLSPELLDLNEVVQGTHKMLRRLIGEDIELRSELGVLQGLIKMDRGQLEQVLVNLVVNARDAMPDGGVIAIRTAQDGDPDSPDAHQVLELRDTGAGIPTELLDRIFDPFFTTKRAGRGTGLGLALVKTNIEGNGGSIELSSTEGTGTVVRARLPVTTERPALSQQPGPPTQVSGEKVLVVEDDDAVRSSIVRMLEGAGYEVVEARLGEEALTREAELEGAIDAAIVDMVMPGMSGEALVEKLWERRSSLPVIFVTGYASRVTRLRLDAARRSVILAKPFRESHLLEVLGQILAEPVPSEDGSA